MKALVASLVVAMVLVIPVRAQTMAEQLQRAIYTEETLRNPTEATRLYRQLLATPNLPDAIAADAQARLAKLLLALSPGNRPPVVMAESVYPGMPARGVVEKGRYRHVPSGITFTLPAGWSAGPTRPSSDDGDLVTLTDGTRGIQIWMIKETTPADQVAARVAGAPAEKVEQRHAGYTIPGSPDPLVYLIIPESLRTRTINGKHAITATATYVGSPRPGAALTGMREHMTWIYTEQARLFFFTRATQNELPALLPAFEELVTSAQVP